MPDLHRLTLISICFNISVWPFPIRVIMMRSKVNLPSFANGCADSDKVYYETSPHSETFIYPFIKLLAKSKCLTKSSFLVNHSPSWLQQKMLKQKAFCGQSHLYIGLSLPLVSSSELNTDYRPDASLLLQKFLVNSAMAEWLNFTLKQAFMIMKATLELAWNLQSSISIQQPLPQAQD